jgi:toxin CptA
MQRPPAISMQIGRSRRAGMVLALIAFIFGVLPFYAWYLGLPVERAGVLVGVWALSAGFLAKHWLHSPQGRLRWDGEVWHWSGLAAPLKSACIQYDFQRSLWLMLEPEQGQRFGLWVDADPTRLLQWQALRRALVGAGSLPLSGVDPMDGSIPHVR